MPRSRRGSRRGPTSAALELAEGQRRAVRGPGQGHVGDACPGLAGAIDPLAAHGLGQDRRPALALERPVLLLVPLDLAEHLVQGEVDGLLLLLVGHATLDLGQEHRGQERVDVRPELLLDPRPLHAGDGERLGVGGLDLGTDVADGLDDRVAVRPLARGAPRAEQGQRRDARVGHVGRVPEGLGPSAVPAHLRRLLTLAPPASRELMLHQPVEALLHAHAQRLGRDGRRPRLRAPVLPRPGLSSRGPLGRPGSSAAQARSSRDALQATRHAKGTTRTRSRCRLMGPPPRKDGCVSIRPDPLTCPPAREFLAGAMPAGRAGDGRGPTGSDAPRSAPSL